MPHVEGRNNRKFDLRNQTHFHRAMGGALVDKISGRFELLIEIFELLLFLWKSQMKYEK